MRFAVWLLVVVAIGAIALADPGTGTVIVSCNESDAELIVDGVLIPDRTPAVLTMPAGTHEIEVRKPPLVAQKQTVVVGDQQQVKLRFELVPLAPAPGSAATVGSGSGAPPPTGSGAPPATGSAQLAATGSAAAKETGSAGSAVGSAASAAGSAAAPVELHAAPALAEIELVTTVPHAIAYVDGAPVRDAPCVLEVEPGEHVVAVYAAGMIPAETIVHAEVGRRPRVDLIPMKQRRRIDVPAP